MSTPSHMPELSLNNRPDSSSEAFPDIPNSSRPNSSSAAAVAAALAGVSIPESNAPPPPQGPPQNDVPSPDGDPGSPGSSKTRKRTTKDFSFGKMLGEGSYSTVVLARETSTNREFAVKILDKKHIFKEKKAKYVHVEKSVLNRLHHPFIVRLYYTFQDNSNLYFVLSYAQNGELLDYIKKFGSFNEECTRFYTAEILVAVAYLHSLDIIHRDLKPENILLDDKMHIKITDFGTAKILGEDLQPPMSPAIMNGHHDFNGPPSPASPAASPSGSGRANSFVGTAEYVSPELLVEKSACKASDLWALGCIVYQLLAGRPPFKGPNEYQTFQKITKLEYKIPNGFPQLAQDLVEKLLVLDPNQRLGGGPSGASAVKSHPFFEGLDFDTLKDQTAPKLQPLQPPGEEDTQSIAKKSTDSLVQEVANLNMKDGSKAGSDGSLSKSSLPPELEKWARFLLEEEVLLHSGVLWKRRGLFSKRRVFLLTKKPRLLYIDEEKMVQKGEVPLASDTTLELKNKKNFHINTPNRTYYLEDPTGKSQEWIKQLQYVIKSL